MMKSGNYQRHIEALAEESLNIFARIAEAAAIRISESLSGSGRNAFANLNILTTPKAAQNLKEIRRSGNQSYHHLTQEPVIARVIFNDEHGKRKTYYVCRVAPVSIENANIRLASYRADAGRLAELPIGHNVWERNGKEIPVEILENAEFRPVSDNEEWDSRPAKLEGTSYGPLKIDSLRVFLPDETTDSALLEHLLDEEREPEGVSRDMSPDTITKMELRDQPILDQFQGKLFRLPLDSRILILGAPGTGKTTTLIRRLGQKLDVEFLSESEKQTAGLTTLAAEEEHSRSWIMFTPTKLLKLYVKEAFNRENIPAPDDRVSTWDDFRNDIARNKFGVLRSGSNRSPYVMRDSAATLKRESETDVVSWFADFDRWQKTTFQRETRDSVKVLLEATSPEIVRIGGRLSAILDASEEILQPGVFSSFAKEEDEIRKIVGEIKKSSDKKIRGVLNLQVNKDRNFLDEFASFIEQLPASQGDPEDQESDIEEEEDEPNQPRIGRAAAVAFFMRTIRALARARARNRNISQTSRTGRLVEWLDDRTPSDASLLETGENLLLQTALRRFVNPARRYISGIPRRYGRFRRERQRENRWYCAEGFKPTDIHPLEVDLVLLSMLRGTGDLIREARSLADADNPARETLARLQELRRTQVLIDEATDFSPVQLACMAAISRPEAISIFACGDFNQRVTNWGTRSMEQMKWAIPNVEKREISIPYRQTVQMREFAGKIIELSGGEPLDMQSPDHEKNNQGVPPALAVQMRKKSEIANWLAQRIHEIERFLNQLPSIAVFVNGEDEIQPMTAALDDALANLNIHAVACSEGRILGEARDIRVFNVEHIKGLEFEAVFFVDIDKLAAQQPDLFDKYMYVGATRAATYLGITCENDLPYKMAHLRELFEQGW